METYMGRTISGPFPPSKENRIYSVEILIFCQILINEMNNTDTLA
jgi:hypothetical protein